MTHASRRLLLLISFFALAAVAPPELARAEVSGAVSLSFDSRLAPYGEWVVVAHHGRVWRPRGVAAGWRPYYHGRWVWTDDGWFWDSTEPWGWATYHYGRWYVDPAFGWVWVPGNAWAPAWVTWRFGGGAIGWAPLLPGFSVWWTAGYPVHQSAWVFVPERRFVGARVERVAFSPARTGTFLSTTRLAAPRSVSGASAPRLGGPPRRYVERQMGRRIAPVRVTAAATPQAARAGRREGSVSAYRPPRPVATRAAPHAATARSATHAGAGRSGPHAATVRPAPHASAAPAPHGAVVRSTPHAATPRSGPRPATERSAPHGATARSAQHAAAAPRASAAAQRAAPPSVQGRAAPQRRPPPAADSARQAQRDSRRSAG